MKNCFKCNSIKPLADFYPHKGMKDGRLNKCKTCTKADTARWASANPEKHAEYNRKDAQKPRYRDWYYRRNYGITLDTFVQMSATQGGCCAICRKARKLYVDHDHKTNKVRALLCRDCNTSIGLLGEDFDALVRAAKYIQEHKGII